MINTLENEYAHATECLLATLSGLMMRKRSLQGEIMRHTNIALRMLRVCEEHAGNIAWGNRPTRFPRVHDMLEQAKSDPERLDGAVEKFKEKCRG